MRKCDNPPPKFGGESCVGSDRQTMPCSLSDCPGKSGNLKISRKRKEYQGDSSLRAGHNFFYLT